MLLRRLGMPANRGCANIGPTTDPGTCAGESLADRSPIQSLTTFRRCHRVTDKRFGAWLRHGAVAHATALPPRRLVDGTPLITRRPRARTDAAQASRSAPNGQGSSGSAFNAEIVRPGCDIAVSAAASEAARRLGNCSHSYCAVNRDG